MTRKTAQHGGVIGWSSATDETNYACVRAFERGVGHEGAVRNSQARIDRARQGGRQRGRQATVDRFRTTASRTKPVRAAVHGSIIAVSASISASQRRRYLCASGLDKPQHRCSKCGQSERDSDKSESHSIDHDRLPFILLPGGSGASLEEQDVEAGLRPM